MYPKLDPDKLARQTEGFEIWRKNKARGGFIYPTGFGKTFIIIMALRHMNEKHPDWNAIIIVPNTNLLNDWENLDTGHIKKWGLKNVRVFVINTFVKYRDWKCDFFAVDEVHRVLNEDANQFSLTLSIVQFNYVMVMSATITKYQEEFLNKAGIQIVDRMTQEEAIQRRWIAPSNIYNLAVHLNEIDLKTKQDIDNNFKFYFARFGHNFEMVMACNVGENVSKSARDGSKRYLGKKTGKEWREYWANVNNWDGTDSHPYSPKNIGKNAALCMYYTRMRKDLLQNYPSKLTASVQVLDKFKGEKFIVFTESSTFANKLKGLLGKRAVIYHTKLKTVGIKDDDTIEVLDMTHRKDLISKGYKIFGNKKLKQKAIDDFSSSTSGVDVIITVRALDEGADFPKVDGTLHTAYSSKQRQSIQREGRAGRIEYNNPNKKTKNIYLYIPDSQEAKWLTEAQNGKVVRYIDSVDQINQVSLNLGTINGEVTIDAAQIRTIGADSK